MNETFQPLPKYVLLEDNNKLHAKVDVTSSDAGHEVLYAFSSSESYARFVSSTERKLRPYPIAKGLLKRVLEEAGDVPPLLAIDATDQRQDEVAAITVKDAVESTEDNEGQIPVSYTLRFISEQDSYSVMPLAVTS